MNELDQLLTNYRNMAQAIESLKPSPIREKLVQILLGPMAPGYEGELVGAWEEIHTSYSTILKPTWIEPIVKMDNTWDDVNQKIADAGLDSDEGVNWTWKYEPPEQD